MCSDDDHIKNETGILSQCLFVYGWRSPYSHILDFQCFEGIPFSDLQMLSRVDVIRMRSTTNLSRIRPQTAISQVVALPAVCSGDELVTGLLPVAL